MAVALRERLPVETSAIAPDLSCCQMNFQTGVVADDPYIGKSFSDVLQQRESYRIGDKVTVAFVTGHPKNDLRTEKRKEVVNIGKDGKQTPVTVATDNDWDTQYHWEKWYICLESDYQLVHSARDRARPLLHQALWQREELLDPEDQRNQQLDPLLRVLGTTP